jgi:membrane fusion protein, multidrug efflux system
MKTIYQLIIPVLVLFSLTACQDDLAKKKAELEKMKQESAELLAAIEQLENEIGEVEPASEKFVRKDILITTLPVQKGIFKHYVEVTGSVLSKKNVNIGAEISGRIQQIVAVEGMRVAKGDVLAQIDAESVQRNIEEIEKQLELVKVVFEKQERLWNQQIGTEIQYLEAKTRKESLEKNLASLKVQGAKTVVRAPFSGTVESVKVRLGEVVQPGTPILQFVGDSDLFLEADISEKYVGIVNKGDEVEIIFPSLNQVLQTKVSAVGAIINPNNRTFKVEISVPNMPLVKPNMISVVKIKDHENVNALIIPNNLILQDLKGDYVYVVENNIAKKKYIQRGMTYKEFTEILEGLNENELLVDKGFREVGDNFSVNIAK